MVFIHSLTCYTDLLLQRRGGVCVCEFCVVAVLGVLGCTAAEGLLEVAMNGFPDTEAEPERRATGSHGPHTVPEPLLLLLLLSAWGTGMGRFPRGRARRFLSSSAD